MFLLVLAHPGCCRQNPKSRKMVVCVCVSRLLLLYLIHLSDSLTPSYPVFLLPSALLFEEFHFVDHDHLNRLHTPSVYFPLLKRRCFFHSVYSSCNSSMPLSIFLFFQLPYFFFSSSFHHHVSLCLHGPFDNPHVTCAVFIIKFFTLCQCSFSLKYFHSASATLSVTMLWYTSRLFLLELPYMHSWFKLLMPSFCCIKPHVHY